MYETVHIIAFSLSCESCYCSSHQYYFRASHWRSEGCRPFNSHLHSEGKLCNMLVQCLHNYQRWIQDFRYVGGGELQQLQGTYTVLLQLGYTARCGSRFFFYRFAWLIQYTIYDRMILKSPQMPHKYVFCNRFKPKFSSTTTCPTGL